MVAIEHTGESEQVRKRGLLPLVQSKQRRGQAPLPDLFLNRHSLCATATTRQKGYNVAMPKISDIEETPNPNAVKFILREPVSNGVARQYGSAELAENDPLAKSLFDIGHVGSVFYMDRMITVEKDDE